METKDICDVVFGLLEDQCEKDKSLGEKILAAHENFMKESNYNHAYNHWKNLSPDARKDPSMKVKCSQDECIFCEQHGLDLS